MNANIESREAVVQSLQQIVGAAGFQRWSEVDSLLRSEVEAAIADASVIGMVYPHTEAELAAVMTFAHQHQLRVLPRGAGSKLSWGGLVQGVDLVLSTQRLNALIDHAVGDLTVTVEAGMRFADLQAVLAQAGQFLAIDPAFPGQATLGGIVATADTGSLRQRYSGVRDMLLGISFVRADGQVAKAGGRVVKNVAGYDLMKLLTGSYGTLGIITQMTLRVYPLPEQSQTVGWVGEATAIAQASQFLLRSHLTPTSVDWISAALCQRLGLGERVGVLIRFQGMAPSAQAQMQQVVAAAQSLELYHSTYSGQADTDLWQQLQDHINPRHQPEAITCKIGIRPSDEIALFQQIEALGGSDWLGQVHGASGLGRLTLLTAPPAETLLQIRAFCEAHRGFLSVLQAPASLKQQIDVWGYSGNALSLMQALKQQFDPQHSLSPQRFVGGI